MKALFDDISQSCSKNVTKTYSTSFSLATKMLAPCIRQDIYNVYGFVRLADEIVDSFHDYDKKALFVRFEKALEEALTEKISLNPILNAFQYTVYKYGIDQALIDAFMNSMRLDLTKSEYTTREEYQAYIYGSADVVGLMCLKIFVKGDQEQFDVLKEPAMALGSPAPNSVIIWKVIIIPVTVPNRPNSGATMAIIFNRLRPDSMAGRSLRTASCSFSSSDSGSSPGFAFATASTRPNGLSRVDEAGFLSCDATFDDIPWSTIKRQIARRIATKNTPVIT